jgi:hypothetical protein
LYIGNLLFSPGLGVSFSQIKYRFWRLRVEKLMVFPGPKPLDELHYLFIEKRDRIVAHCLELDLVAVSNETEDAERRLNHLVSTQIINGLNSRGFEGIYRRAPEELWAMLDDAQKLPDTTLEVKTDPPLALPIKKGQLSFELLVLRAIVPAAA